LLIAFSDLAASCQDRLFHNLFYPQAGEAVFEGLNTKSIARDSRSEKTRKVRRLVWLGLCLAAASAAAADDQALLRISGSYIAYSYDFNQLFGENVHFRWAGYDVSGRSLKIDFASRACLVFGKVILGKSQEVLEADELLIDPDKNIGALVAYGESIRVREIGEWPDTSSAAKASFLLKRQALTEWTLAKIQKSLIYYTATAVDILPDYDVWGFDVTLFVEGLESVGFKKFKLTGGGQRTNGFSLDKVWFTRAQGLFGKASYSSEQGKKIQILSQLYYEEHSILKNYAGLKRQLDFQTSTTWMADDRVGLGAAGNYNSTSLWNARFWLDRRSKDAKNNVLLDFAYNKPLESRGEAWVGLQSSLNSERWGSLAFLGKYELHNQALANLSYTKTLLKTIQVFLVSSYSQITIGRTGGMSKIFTGNLSLSYNAHLFNAATDYYLNYDLFGNQRLSRPQLRLGLNSFSFYGGLLTASMNNIFIHNTVKSDLSNAQSYSNNTALNLSARPLFLQKDLLLSFNLALEQFLEKEGRNFTSGGLILNAGKQLGRGISLEGFYSVQSRRKTKTWLIEGTTSQDLSAMLRINPGPNLKGWLSLSYDPKNGEWRQSFADVSVGIINNWKFQSLLNYDFFRKRLNNIEFYLIREAGRFELRFIWRSISKQFLVELVPLM